MTRIKDFFRVISKIASRSIAIVLVACLSANPAWAQAFSKSIFTHVRAGDWDFEYRWYEADPFPSLEQAANAIISLQSFFSDYNGYLINKVVITSEGLAVHAQGASAMYPSQVYISFKETDRVELLYFPAKGYPWGINFVNRDPSKSVTLRTSDEGLARQFANASVTFIMQANPEFVAKQNITGLHGFVDDPTMFQKAMFKGSTGFYVVDVDRGGPSQKAGVMEGDIIIEANGQPVSAKLGFNLILGQEMNSNIEPVLDLKVFRAGQVVPIRLIARNLPLRSELVRNPPKLGAKWHDANVDQPVGPGLDQRKGVIVDLVIDGTRAKAMDMRKGDLVIEINGKPVANSESLSKILEEGPVTVAKVIRDGAVVELKAPTDAKPLRPQPFGLSVREQAADGTQPARLEVVAVTTGSPAAKLDLRQGDILIEVNGKPVRATADLGAIIGTGPVTSAKVERAGKVVALGGGAVTSF